MDKLKQLVASKRKATEEEFGGKKFMKRAEIEELRIKKLREEEEIERIEKEEKKRKLDQDKSKLSSRRHTTPDGNAANDSITTDKFASIASQKHQQTSSPPHIDLPPTEVIRRLRLLKEPITLFGETEQDRYQRLLIAGKNVYVNDEAEGGQQGNIHAALLKEERGKAQLRRIQGTTVGIDNRAMGTSAKGITTHDTANIINNTTTTNNNNVVDTNNDNNTADETNPLDKEKEEEQARLMSSFRAAADAIAEKNMPMEDKISKYIKEWMLDWEQDLQSRPQEVIASASGRQADVRYRETQEYLRPLYSRLKNRSLEPALLAGIKLIIDLMRQRNYLHAYKVYMGVAIGNAPWPIGVTHVGLHERSAREKISFKYSSGSAHIMNDEATRKFIQALKRLMTFCQRRYPTDPSRSVDFDGFASQGVGATGAGSDKASLLQAVARGDDVAPAPAPTHLDAVTGAVKIPEKWEHIIKGALEEVARSDAAEEAEEEARFKR